MLLQVVIGDINLRNAVRIYAVLGLWQSAQNLRKHPPWSSQVSSVHTSRCAKPTRSPDHTRLDEAAGKFARR